jgi:hypothetical protein
MSAPRTAHRSPPVAVFLLSAFGQGASARTYPSQNINVIAIYPSNLTKDLKQVQSRVNWSA